MHRGKRRKRINYYGHHYFEGEAVRALAPTPQDYGFPDLDEISVVSREVAKWNAARDKFSWSLTAVVAVVIASIAGGIWGWNVLYLLLVPPVWLLVLIPGALLRGAYGAHPSAARLTAFKGATERWHRTAEPFAEHAGAVKGWIRMSGLDFEKAITRILKTRGFDARVTKASGDGGIDIEIFANGRLDTAIQCKRYKSACGPSVVRELYGAMLHAGAARAVLICLGGFSAAAREFAAGKPIRLVDSKQLIEFRRGGADDMFRESG
ncbi:MAG: restriction endonuclease [Candidatus Binataceae bacterium]